MLAAVSAFGRVSLFTWEARALMAVAGFVVLVCFIAVIRIGVARNSLQWALLQTALLAAMMAGHVAYLAKHASLETVCKAIIVYLIWLGICIHISLDRNHRPDADATDEWKMR
jgi:hypothetical protein